MENMERTERELDFMDMLEAICKKWRMILILMLVGTIIGGIASTVMALYKKGEESLEFQKQSGYQKLCEIKEKLDELEDAEALIEEADNYVLQYRAIEKDYQLQNEYMENSIFYKMNEDNVCSMHLIYYIDNHFSVIYPEVDKYNTIDNIAQYYIAEITSDNVFDRIITEIYPDSEYKYIKELVNVYSTMSGMLEINIVSDSVEITDAISMIIKNAIEEITSKANSVYGDVACTLQSEKRKQESDNSVSKSHTTQVDNLLAYYNNMKDISKMMSGIQLEYYESKIDMIKLERKNSAEILPVYKYMSKKIIAIAGILGILVALIILGCSYISNGRIKTYSDLENTMRLVFLGNISADYIAATNKIDYLVHKLFHNDKDCINQDIRIDVITNAITEALKRENMSSICIVSTLNIQDCSALSKLIAKLTKCGVNVIVADKFLNNVRGSNEVNDSDMIVACEVIDSSKYADIEQMLRLLKINNACVLGCISV